MSAPNASSSSSQLVSYAQDVDYTHTKGFKQFKAWYNVKNVRAACNDPNGIYPAAETIYQAVKGPGCTLRSFDSLSLDNFISSGAVAARCRLKCLSLAPYYAVQMKCCMQKMGSSGQSRFQFGGDQRLSATSRCCQYWDLPLHGQCSVYGEIELWIWFWYPLINLHRPRTRCTVRTTR